MLNITITEQTPDNMLRAIRAACNELLGDTTADLTTQAAQHVTEANRLTAAADAEAYKAACLNAHDALATTASGSMLLQGTEALKQAFDQAVEKTDDTVVAKMLIDADAPETDSTGAEWNPELHASTKTKNTDGTWKKRRGAGKADEPTPVQLPEGYGQVSHVPVAIEDATPAQVAAALPPLPPAPVAPLVTMNDIYALISGGKCVLNDVIAGAQAMGFADVGAFSRDATPEQRAQLLQELTA